ncbi:MAG: MFS transporter, partial [Proteobacteria bacterium]
MSAQNPTPKAAWAGIWAMTLGVSGIMIGEFLPAGLLTPMAQDLSISEGMAGQAVTATSIFAVIASLLTAYLSRKMDRRKVLLLMSAFMALSSALVALSSHFGVLLFGRVLLGIALGGAWSLSTALAIRLVNQEDVPKALGIIHSGASLSAVLAAPLGSFVGNLIGWRDTFLLAAGLGALAFIFQWFALPALRPLETVRMRTTYDVLKKPLFTFGLVAISLAFCGRFASFTYMRPFLENMTGLRGSEVSGVFMIFDLAYFFGTLFIARFVRMHLKTMLIVPPLLLSVACAGLMMFGAHILPTIGFIFLLGAAFAPIPIAWSTWSASTAPENTETAGGLFVAAVQLSAAMGAVGGGLIYD